MGTQGIAIGGMAEEDISNFIAADWKENELNAGVGHARDAYTAGYNEAKGYQSPWVGEGQQAFTSLGQMAQEQPAQFSYTGQDMSQDPGYQFRLQQGQNAIQSSAAAKGMGLSPATMKALDTYSQGYASNEYQKAYDRALESFSTNQKARAERFGELNTTAGYGERASTRLSDLASQYGATMGDLQLYQTQGSIGNIEAARQAANEQGSHLQQIGAGQMNSQQQQGGSGYQSQYNSQGYNTNANSGEFTNYGGQGGTTEGGFTSDGAGASGGGE